MAVAFVLPKPRICFPVREWLPVFTKSILILPQAYKEAIEMMIFPHRYEGLQLEKVRPGRPDFLIFLDIFFITFTPKTVVIKYHKEGWYEVHKIRRIQPLIDEKQK
ncbi:MAG: cation:proton antiporter [Geminocystis sp.]|nr:cation:proton antiporter [Geminocystis sp.]MDW8463766.1 cation:proton antiporter [Geminocystis sp.]